ncbi:MAG: hypothetical protein FWC01_06535 [Treponema sp.]|nr:hypothetical protein [Treponema sp.]MCL2252708.1 hypothetical protein [Treponema sp.]
MKRKIWKAGVIILIMMIGFAFTTCALNDGNAGNDGLQPAGDGSINFSSTKTYSVYTRTWNSGTGVHNITPYTGGVIDLSFFSDYDENTEMGIIKPLSDLGSGTWEVKASSSGVSIKLGTPDPSFLESVGNYGEYDFTVTDGLMIKSLFGFFSSSTGGNFLYWEHITDTSYSYSGFIFANKAGVMKGIYTDTYCGCNCNIYDCEGGSDCQDKKTATVTYNLEFKQGWNIIIGKIGDSYNYVTGIPENDLKWIIRDN